MPLSLAEVKRIQKATGVDHREFVVVEEIDPFSVSDLEAVTPVFKSLHTRGSRIRLKVTPFKDGIAKCVWLGEDGCKLEKSVRPHGCRLYPFTFNGRLAKGLGDNGLVRCPSSEPCLALEEQPRYDFDLALSLGTTADELVEIGVQREADAEHHRKVLLEEEEWHGGRGDDEEERSR